MERFAMENGTRRMCDLIPALPGKCCPISHLSLYIGFGTRSLSEKTRDRMVSRYRKWTTPLVSHPLKWELRQEHTLRLMKITDRGKNW
jgi:hypothetical protein